MLKVAQHILVFARDASRCIPQDALAGFLRTRLRLCSTLIILHAELLFFFFVNSYSFLASMQATLGLTALKTQFVPSYIHNLLFFSPPPLPRRITESLLRLER